MWLTRLIRGCWPRLWSSWCARCGRGRPLGGPPPPRGRVGEIASTLRTRAKLGREESTQAIRRGTGQLAGLADKAAAEAAAVLRNGRRALPRALSGQMRGRLRRALDELAVTIERTTRIAAQTRNRLAGQTPGAATRAV